MSGLAERIPRARLPNVGFAALCCLALWLAAVCPARGEAEEVQDAAFLYRAILEELRPGAAVSKILPLSDYLPSLKGSGMDTPVYILEAGFSQNDTTPSFNFDDKKPSAAMPTVLIIGGTHEDEIAGVLAAILFIEHAVPVRGRLIVVPRLNASAAGTADPERPGPHHIVISGASGERYFRYGSRYTDPNYEIEADPIRFYPPGARAGAGLSSREFRNINRNYPGDEAGSLTARTARAIMNLIARENVRVAFDLHEAGPSSGLAWAVIAHPKTIDYAAMAILDLGDKGLNMVLDLSREEHRGLSHREWGERTEASAYLIETLNPGQVPGGLPVFDHVNNAISPLWKRIGYHVETVLAILGIHAEMDEPSGWIGIDSMPGINELKANLAVYF
jgi:predicted deacylase